MHAREIGDVEFLAVMPGDACREAFRQGAQLSFRSVMDDDLVLRSPRRRQIRWPGTFVLQPDHLVNALLGVLDDIESLPLRQDVGAIHADEMRAGEVAAIGSPVCSDAA